MHFILIKPVVIDHMSYVTLFKYSLGRSHKTDLTVYMVQTCLLPDGIAISELKLLRIFVSFLLQVMIG